MRPPPRNPAGSRGTLVGRVLLVGVLLLSVAACGAGGGSAAGEASSISTATTAAAPAATPSPVSATPSAAPSSTVTAGPAAPAASPAPPTSAGSTSAATPGPLLLPASPPVSVVVPAIGVNASLIDLGRNPDGTIEVPSLDDPDSKPGWYTGSPAPGALGPAIILGHIDSRQFGPGVFYSLQNLQAGDGVEVTRADGTVAQFSVDSVQTVAKSDFPTLEVYGNIDHAGLRLITCGGEFDPDARSYESNIIVFASLVGSRQA